MSRPAIGCEQPDVAGLGEVVAALRDWQVEGAPVQLHPGDLGWFWRHGPAATAAAVRTWRRRGRLVAVGLLDGPDVLRLAVDAGAADHELAAMVAAAVRDPSAGVLAGAGAAVEARAFPLLDDALDAGGWHRGEAWALLRRSLAGDVPDPAIRVEAVGPASAGVRTALHRAAFDSEYFTAARWQAMASGPLYREARCLVAFDDTGTPVAAATVWSAGAGRPGLLEPVGVPPEHRGRGHGRAVTLAAAAALRAMGASSATVCTPAANTVAVRAYRSAGFTQQPDSCDRQRPAVPGS